MIYKGKDNYYLEADSTSGKPPTRATTAGSPLGTTGLPVNTWTYLTGTYDGVTLRLYVNGGTGKQPCANWSNHGLDQSSANWRRQFLWTVFPGTLDEIRIYNRALNATEIQSDMVSPITP